MNHLLQIGLKLWIKQRCDAIENIKLETDTSMKDIFKGTLSKIVLTAENLTFKGLNINRIIVRTNLVKFKLKAKDNIPSLTIVNKFRIKGELNFTEANINQIFNSEKWCALFYNLLNLELHSKTIKTVKLVPNMIKLIFNESEDLEKSKIDIYLSIANGKLCLKNQSLSIEGYLPQDDSIRIDNFIIEDKILRLKLSSLVQP